MTPPRMQAGRQVHGPDPADRQARPGGRTAPGTAPENTGRELAWGGRRPSGSHHEGRPPHDGDRRTPTGGPPTRLFRREVTPEHRAHHRKRHLSGQPPHPDHPSPPSTAHQLTRPPPTRSNRRLRTTSPARGSASVSWPTNLPQRRTSPARS